MDNIENAVRSFIEENFLFRSDRAALSDTESLLDSGIMDSTGVLELVAFLESAFPIQMSDAEIVPENLDSITSIAKFLKRKLATQLAA
jgi:acyl carrier protein